MKVEEHRAEKIDEAVEALAVISRYFVDQAKCEDLDATMLIELYAVTKKLNLVDAYLTAESILNGGSLPPSWNDRFGFIDAWAAARERVLGKEDGDR